MMQEQDKEIKEKLIFNPSGKEDLSERKLVGGNTTNLLDLATVKYIWARDIYKIMMENFWIPEKEDTTNDIQDYASLTEEERNIYDDILSSLVFLDSIQTNNLPRLCDYVTAPEISLVLIIQSFQEALHSKSYGNIINTVIPKEKLANFFNNWQRNEVLYKRNEFLVKIFQQFRDEPSLHNFFRVLIADYILESISFYMGFNFFYELSFTKGKMLGTTDIIRLINRDELTHVLLFQRLITTFKEENNIEIDVNEIQSMFREAVGYEKEWIRSLISSNCSNNKFLSIDLDTADKYIEYIADIRLRDIDIPTIFNSVQSNPLHYLDKVSGLSNTASVKSNFFETNVTSYQMSSSIEGWDEI